MSGSSNSGFETAELTAWGPEPEKKAAPRMMRRVATRMPIPNFVSLFMLGIRVAVLEEKYKPKCD